MGRLSWVAIVAALPALACSGEDTGGSTEPPNPCPESAEAACAAQVEQGAIAEDQRGECIASALRDCSTSYYLRNYPAHPQPSCIEGSVIDPIDANVDVALFRGVGVTDAAVVEQTQGLQRYYEPHNLWFFTDRPSAPNGMSYAMVGSEQELMTALRNAGIPLDRELTPEQKALANQILGDLMLAPLRAFVNDHSVPRASRVNVIVIDRIVSPELEQALAQPFQIALLGISPALLAAVQADDPEADLYSLLGLPADFTPTLFMASGVTRQYTSYPDNVIAHEMGHALGLPHTEAYGNLMTQGSPLTCRAALDSGQTGQISLPSTLAPSSGYELLLELRRRLFARLLPRA